MGSPLWKRGVRGDFAKSFDSIGVLHSILAFLKGKRHHIIGVDPRYTDKVDRTEEDVKIRS